MSELTVRVKQGQIQGIKENYSIFNSEFYSFYGVPYAEPPINQLRFKDPVKVKPWKGIRNGQSPRDCFVQYSFYKHRMIGCEDILYVNIHTPQLPQKGEPLKAVIANIHAGATTWGSPNPDHHGSPNYIMHHDVVYVNIGFRLNILGFLNLNLAECSGNQGLKDIVMALQWIHENIHVFNGDASNITIIGASGGAALIHLLLLSPTYKGLFHKAIMMGQYTFNCLSSHCIDQASRALDLARDLGFNGNDPKHLLKFFKKLPAEYLILAVHKFDKKISHSTLKSFVGCPFAETIDSKIMPVPPRQLISSTEQMPIIFGICERESIVGLIDKEKRKYEQIINNAKVYRQSIWGWTSTLTDAELVQLDKQVQSFYSKHLSEDTTPLCCKIDIMSDAAYSDVYDTLLNVISPNYPVYVYQFQYESETAVMKTGASQVIGEKIQGTFHCDDMSYWCCTSQPKSPITKKIINTFTGMFCSFAKTGNPNYESIETQWRPSTPENPCHLSINEEIRMVDGKLNGERYEFWDKLKEQFKHD